MFYLNHNRHVSNAGESEYSLIALDFFWCSECLLEIVGEFYGWSAFGVVEFADQAEGIEDAIAARIATPEIVGE